MSYERRYENRYMDEMKIKEAKIKEEEQKKEDSAEQSSTGGSALKEEGTENKLQSQTSKSSSAEQDLDTFLLGDLDDSDGGPGIESMSLSLF